MVRRRSLLKAAMRDPGAAWVFLLQTKNGVADYAVASMELSIMVNALLSHGLKQSKVLGKSQSF